MRSTITIAAALVCALSSAAPAQTRSEAGYPDKPIRLIVPNAPGSSNDVLGRALALRLSEVLGQQIVVDNRAGAAGVIGVEIAVKAAPDGYTLVSASSGSHSVAPHIYKKLPYDPLNDLAPVALYAINPNLLAVNPSLGVGNVRELIQLMKAKPGQLNMASAGQGSTSHLAAALFAAMAGVKAVHVPYKGGGPSIAAVIANEAQWVFTPLAGPLPHVRSGRLKALAVGGSHRTPLLPEVPTVAEAGVPGYNSNGWNGIMVPRATPKAIVAKLNAAIVKVLNTPELRDQFALQGTEPATGTPAQFDQFIRTEYERYGRAVKLAGIQID